MSSNSDNMFNGLVGKAFNEAINSTQKDNNPAYVRLFLALTGILFFVGAEAVKVFFRKNFGIKGINIIQLIICCICFLGLGILGILQFLFPEKIFLYDELGITASSYLITGIAYIFLAVYLLRKGILERYKAQKTQNLSDFRGEPDVLKVLADKGWSQNKMRYLAEPMYTLLLGLVMALYNPIGAIPLVFCALSVWGHAVMEFLFMQNPFQPDLTPQQATMQSPQTQFGQPMIPTYVKMD